MKRYKLLPTYNQILKHIIWEAKKAIDEFTLKTGKFPGYLIVPRVFSLLKLETVVGLKVVFADTEKFLCGFSGK